MNAHETFVCMFLQRTERNENSKHYSSSISRNVACFRHNDTVFPKLDKRVRWVWDQRAKAKQVVKHFSVLVSVLYEHRGVHTSI